MLAGVRSKGKNAIGGGLVEGYLFSGKKLIFSSEGTNVCIEVPALCNDNILWIPQICFSPMVLSKE